MSNSKQFNLPGGSVAFGVVPLDPRNGEPLLQRTEIDVMTGTALGLAGVTVGALRIAMPNGVASTVEEIPRTLLASPAGVPMTIRSLNAEDVGDVVRVSALGVNYERIPPFDVTLNGTTPVPLPGGPFTRINGMSRVSGDFAGNILVENSAVVYGAVAAGQQLQRSSQYTVPAGFRLFVSDLISSLSKDATSGANIPLALQGKPVASTVFGDFLDWCLQRDGTSAVHFSQRYSGGIAGPFDLRIIGTASIANMDVQTHLSALLQDLSV